jgi:hypothetical protein
MGAPTQGGIGSTGGDHIIGGSGLDGSLGGGFAGTDEVSCGTTGSLGGLVDGGLRTCWELRNGKTRDGEEREGSEGVLHLDGFDSPRVLPLTSDGKMMIWICGLRDDYVSCGERGEERRRSQCGEGFVIYELEMKVQAQSRPSQTRGDAGQGKGGEPDGGWCTLLGETLRPCGILHVQDVLDGTVPGELHNTVRRVLVIQYWSRSTSRLVFPH